MRYQSKFAYSILVAIVATLPGCKMLGQSEATAENATPRATDKIGKDEIGAIRSKNESKSEIPYFTFDERAREIEKRLGY